MEDKQRDFLMVQGVACDGYAAGLDSTLSRPQEKGREASKGCKEGLPDASEWGLPSVRELGNEMMKNK